MSSFSFNNVEDDVWLMQMELKREEAEEVTMEEDEGDSLEVHPPASEPNPHQEIRTISNHKGQGVQEGLPPRKALRRLHRNNFHNMVHNYGVENTPRMHIPSN